MDTESLTIKELNLDLLPPNNNTMWNADQGGAKIVVIGKPGCFAPRTKVMMYDGTSKNVEDVVVGDRVMGDDSTPRNVLELCHEFDEMFKVIPAEWADKPYVVNKEHILVMRLKNESTVNSLLVEMTVSNFLKQSAEQQQNYRVFRQNDVPMLSPFSLESQGRGEYFGFVLDGNHRFLLASRDVVHNTGKSTLIADLLYNKRSIYPCAEVMSGTEDSTGFYKKIIPTTFVHNKLDTERIETYIKRQKLARKHLKNPWSVLLLDDCTDDPAVLRTPLFQNIFKNGRQWKMWFILSLQYCLDIRPVIRSNVDGTFILRETNLRNRKALHENYAGVIPDFKMFCDILDGVTDDYTALYIHNASKSNKMEDCVFYYKAKPVPDGFKFGCQDYWEHCQARFNEEYVEPLV